MLEVMQSGVMMLHKCEIPTTVFTVYFHLNAGREIMGTGWTGPRAAVTLYTFPANYEVNMLQCRDIIPFSFLGQLVTMSTEVNCMKNLL